MRARITLAILLFLAIQPLPASDLAIDPVQQSTPVWCWAAVGEMVFEHYGVANINPARDFQCGIIALLHPVCDQNCYNCQVPAGSLSTMNNMLKQYPSFASRVTRTSTRLRTLARTTSISLSQVRREIDNGRPVVAGISPSGYSVGGVSQHVALIVGYDESDLIVNDPFPFGHADGDPYIAAGATATEPGQYVIAYRSFVDRLRWRETIYGIRCSGSDCVGGEVDDSIPEPAPSPRPTTRYGRSCATPVTRCGPFYDQPALPLGSSCWCQTTYGPSSGQVVTP